jgi:nitrite reductase/ring-hydroxylating ferredoxin subunit
MTATLDPWHALAGAPAPGTELCGLHELPDGGAREFRFGPEAEPFRMVVLRSGERVFGYLNKCPHFGVALNVKPDQFTLFEHTYLYCCVHTAQFRFEDGYCEDGPCAGDSLTPVPVELDGERVCIAREH